MITIFFFYVLAMFKKISRSLNFVKVLQGKKICLCDCMHIRMCTRHIHTHTHTPLYADDNAI